MIEDSKPDWDIIKSEYVGVPTISGINEYAEELGMKREEFLAWLSTRKRVLDLGASTGLLKKQLDVLKETGEYKASTEIYSFDINYATDEGQETAQFINVLAYSGSGLEHSPANDNRIESKFRNTATAGSWRSLPYPADFFDGIVACNSIGRWTKDKDQLLQAFREVDRVTSKQSREGFITTLANKSHSMLFAQNNAKQPVPYTLNEIGYLKPKDHYGIGFNKSLQAFVNICHITIG